MYILHEGIPLRYQLCAGIGHSIFFRYQQSFRPPPPQFYIRKLPEAQRFLLFLPISTQEFKPEVSICSSLEMTWVQERSSGSMQISILNQANLNLTYVKWQKFWYTGKCVVILVRMKLTDKKTGNLQTYFFW